uniref:NME/NM23 nucleoside diphosphate kinase 6 n=1 Tax=Nothoprocta perdicaria TaxID=30464 RepID=A0A8C6ZYU2_NOTPE
MTSSMKSPDPALLLPSHLVPRPASQRPATGAAPPRDVTGATAAMAAGRAARPLQLTLALLKPDAVAHPLVLEAVHETILSHRFLIVRAKELRCGREQSRRFYREHAGRPEIIEVARGTLYIKPSSKMSNGSAKTSLHVTDWALQD